MTFEAILAYLHLLAILTMVVFISSEAALCRVQWLNAAVVERLARVDRVYGIAAMMVLATGVATHRRRLSASRTLTSDESGKSPTRTAQS